MKRICRCVKINDINFDVSPNLTYLKTEDVLSTTCVYLNRLTLLLAWLCLLSIFVVHSHFFSSTKWNVPNPINQHRIVTVFKRRYSKITAHLIKSYIYWFDFKKESVVGCKFFKIDLKFSYFFTTYRLSYTNRRE